MGELELPDGGHHEEKEEEQQSPIEEVALTVDVGDDPSLPVWTFRMWTVGILSCALLSFLNQFFAYRSEPFVISAISAQIVALPMGKFMASVLPATLVRIPFTKFEFSLNPGPFNRKEHVLITIFANSGTAFGNGGAYAVHIVNIIKAFYGRNIHFYTGLLIVVTTQVLGYGWAGLVRKYLVEPASMWWPGNLVQVSLFRTLHEKDSGKGLSRIKFFTIFMLVSFAYYVLPNYLFTVLASLSWVCWAFPKSILAHQLGSGLSGLGIGAFSLDWATTSAFLSSPLVSPWFAIVNTAAGFVATVYIMIPLCYWGNVYNAKTFPILSSHLFKSNGETYDIKAVVNKELKIDWDKYHEQGPVHLSTFFAMTYGLGFAAVAATLSHVACFHGKEIWQMTRMALKQKPDVHTRLMKRYPDIPSWWFQVLMIVSLAAALATCIVFKSEVQLPWWGVLLACALALLFTIPVGVITATTNQTPGLNIITEYIIGYMLPGQPIANVCFKTYGYMSMTQAIAFLSDFKLGHYMKIPPRSMFTVQIVGTIVAATVNMGVAWWLLNSIDNICHVQGSSPWTCPNDSVFFDASVIWGLVGPKRIFGARGHYKELSWFFLAGTLAPVAVWFVHKRFPRVSWIRLVNMPLIFGATAVMPPASPVNFTTWILLGAIFNFFVFRFRKNWWQKYNYVLSAALDAGVAFMGVAVYLALGYEDKQLHWWGNPEDSPDNCPLATCPTAFGIYKQGC